MCSPDGRRRYGEPRWNVDRLGLGQQSNRASARSQGRAIRSIGFLPGGRRVVFGTQDGLLADWDIETGERLHSVPGRVMCHSALALLKSGEIATADSDGLVRIWRFSKPIAGPGISPRTIRRNGARAIQQGDFRSSRRRQAPDRARPSPGRAGPIFGSRCRLQPSLRSLPRIARNSSFMPAGGRRTLPA